jgi:hypothetical protein
VVDKGRVEEDRLLEDKDAVGSCVNDWLNEGVADEDGVDEDRFEENRVDEDKVDED